MGIGLSAQGVNMNRLPGESVAQTLVQIICIIIVFFCFLTKGCICTISEAEHVSKVFEGCHKHYSYSFKSAFMDKNQPPEMSHGRVPQNGRYQFNHHID